MPDEDIMFSGSLVLDLRIWWRHMHTLYFEKAYTTRLNGGLSNDIHWIFAQLV